MKTRAVKATLPPSLRSTSGAGAAATLTLAAIAGQRHNIKAIRWSYSGTPTGGGMVIVVDGVMVFDEDYTAGGPGFVDFPTTLTSTVGGVIAITINGGGGSVVGKLNITGYFPS